MGEIELLKLAAQGGGIVALLVLYVLASRQLERLATRFADTVIAINTEFRHQIEKVTTENTAVAMETIRVLRDLEAKIDVGENTRRVIQENVTELKTVVSLLTYRLPGPPAGPPAVVGAVVPVEEVNVKE